MQHYRWDFIGLSTDEKPTPATSPKVVDGSTFYCSDNSKLYVYCKNQWYEKTVSGGGGEPYVLPIASAETLGGIKVGSNLSIDSETGALSGNPAYTLPTASAEALGGIKVGSNLSIDANGVLSALGGGGITNLTNADCDYPAGDPTKIAMWNLSAGIYKNVDTDNLVINWKSNDTLAVPAGNIFIIYKNSSTTAGIFYTTREIDFCCCYNTNGSGIAKWSMTDSASSNFSDLVICGRNVVNDLASNYQYRPLSANQGKVLNDKIGGDLSTLTTTVKTDLISAINELVTRVSTLEGN